jgi:hypothetical protein
MVLLSVPRLVYKVIVCVHSVVELNEVYCIHAAEKMATTRSVVYLHCLHCAYSELYLNSVLCAIDHFDKLRIMSVVVHMHCCMQTFNLVLRDCYSSLCCEGRILSVGMHEPM